MLQHTEQAQSAIEASLLPFSLSEKKENLNSFPLLLCSYFYTGTGH